MPGVSVTLSKRKHVGCYIMKRPPSDTSAIVFNRL